MDVMGRVDCQRYPWRLYVAAFEEMLGMSNNDNIAASLNMLETTDACRARGEIRQHDLLVHT